MSVLFKTAVSKRGGGTYEGTILNYMDNQGQPKFQNWAQQIIDNDRNIELRNALVTLHGAPGAGFTIHRTKKGQYWNVDRIDMGHVEGVRSNPAPAAAAPPLPGAAPGAPVAGAPAYPANDPAAVAAASQPSIREEKSRSKEQCMRGDAIQAAAVIEAAFGDVNIDRFYANAEIAMNYIVNGLAPPAAVVAPAPVAAAPAYAPPAAPAAPAPAPAPAPVAPVAPAPVAPLAAAPAAPVPPAPAPTVPTVAAPAAPAVPTTPAPAPAAPAPIPAPGAPVVAAQPAAFDDGFGQPGA